LGEGGAGPVDARAAGRPAALLPGGGRGLRRGRQNPHRPPHGNRFGPLKKDQGPTMDNGQKTPSLVLNEHNDGATVNVDAIGYGAPCYEALRERIGGRAVAVNVASPSERRDRSGKYRLMNARAALWWGLREALDCERPFILPRCDSPTA